METEAPLRPAAPGDLALLVSLMREFYDESGYPLDEGRARDALGRLTADPALGRLWLVLHGGEPVGYVALTLGFSLEYYGRDAFVDDLYIRPAFRGAGLGTRVLEAVEAACPALGIRAVHLEVERANGRAQGLYRKRGFRDNDRQLLSKRFDGGPG